MPIIVRLQYCVIRMYFKDHNPPHFHIDTPDGKALMTIRTLEVFEGEVDSRAVREAKDGPRQTMTGYGMCGGSLIHDETRWTNSSQTPGAGFAQS